MFNAYVFVANTCELLVQPKHNALMPSAGFSQPNQGNQVARLFARDTTLWTDDTVVASLIENRLGWLTSAPWMQQQIPELLEWVSATLLRSGYKRVVVLGMGGSSLAPDVFASLFPKRLKFAELSVLDSTSPHAVSLELEQDIENTLYIVASKSGTTLETTDLYRLFFDRLNQLTNTPGKHFIAITNKGSWLENHAREKGFLKTFVNPSDIGGRYSALSFFGVVPAALSGVDVSTLIDRACATTADCQSTDPDGNPGLKLGHFLTEQIAIGRNKMVLILPEELKAVGAWVEQLVAESTGKNGKGILPVCENEEQFDVATMADDCFAVSMTTSSEQEKLVLERCYSLPLVSRLDIGSAFFIWEVATAIASAELGVNPFDEPNVSEAKQSTRLFIETDATLELVTIQENTDFITSIADSAKKSLPSTTMVNLLRPNPQDYIAILAYLPITAEHSRLLESMRNTLSARYNICCTAGFGPRYLHSTGQLHKGGPQTGHFVQIVQNVDVKDDIAVPGRDYSFGELIGAQADGDMAVLVGRSLPVLRVCLKTETQASLSAAVALFAEAAL